MFQTFYRSLIFYIICRFACYFPMSETSVLTGVSYKYSAYCDPVDHNGLCCYENEYQCTFGKCINLSSVCDDNWDCPVGSDIHQCSRTPCKLRTNECDHTCVDYPTGRSRCSCYKGYELSDKGKCVDIDECKTGVHICSHECKNLNGTFSCTCIKGFKQELKDLSSTRFINNSRPRKLERHCQVQDKNVLVIYNYENWLYFYNVKTKKSTPFVPSGIVDSIDYDPLTDIVYWANGTTMCRSYIQGAKKGYVTVGHPQILQTPKFENISDKRIFALDWVTKNVYWARPRLDEPYTDILVSKINSTQVVTLGFTNKIEFFVMDPIRGMFYWSNNREPYIKRSLDYFKIWYVDSYVKYYIKDQEPHSLAIDNLEFGKFYWVDSKSHTIYYRSKSKFDLMGPVHTTSKERAPVALEVFDGYIYWLTNQTNELIRIDLFGSIGEEVLLKFSDKLSSNILKIYHPNKFNNEINYAGTQCKNFSDVCLYDIFIKRTVIRCPDNVQQDDSGKCKISEESSLNDPLDCNCDDLIKICDHNSPYFDYHCSQHYRSSSLSFSIYLLFSFLTIIAVIIISFTVYKKIL